MRRTMRKRRRMSHHAIADATSGCCAGSVNRIDTPSVVTSLSDDDVRITLVTFSKSTNTSMTRLVGKVTWQKILINEINRAETIDKTN